ncbi:MAG TPA: diacylglycerol kinase family lipid kinase [Candidatus Aminicenantes bacterium]|nr:diacylglycerol kinase family lipid kinase [Candidatus Aminicenantes bacterium]
MPRNERILIILNPSSGVVSKDIAASVIFQKLRRHFDTVSIINSNSPAHGSEITRQALPHFDIITAFGGDGTINSIAGSLVGTDKTLGILPGGSGNGLVRNLGIPLSWRKALDTLVQGTDTLVDVGKLNDRFFFNVAGVGLDGLIAKKFNLQSRYRGIMPYVYYGLKGYFEMPSFRVRIRMDDREYIDDEILIVAFANFKQYGGKAVIAPFASPVDNHLDLCILQKFSLLGGGLNVQRLFTGNIHKAPFYRGFKFQRLVIESLSGVLPSTIDGEYGGEELSRYTVETLPSKIRIRVPADCRLS